MIDRPYWYYFGVDKDHGVPFIGMVAAATVRGRERTHTPWGVSDGGSGRIAKRQQASVEVLTAGVDGFYQGLKTMRDAVVFPVTRAWDNTRGSVGRALGNYH